MIAGILGKRIVLKGIVINIVRARERERLKPRDILMKVHRKTQIEYKVKSNGRVLCRLERIGATDKY